MNELISLEIPWLFHTHEHGVSCKLLRFVFFSLCLRYHIAMLSKKKRGKKQRDFGIMSKSVILQINYLSKHEAFIHHST